MNLDLLKSKEKSNTKVQTSELHPNIPVITLLAETDNSDKRQTKMIKFNINALTTLNIGGIGREDYNRIIMFENYLVSDDDEADRYDIALFATDQKVIKADKNYKSYDIALGTRKCVSSEIYDMLAKRFNLDTTVNNYIEFIPTNERTGGAFTVRLLTNNANETPVQLFNKGEDVTVEMTQY